MKEMRSHIIILCILMLVLSPVAADSASGDDIKNSQFTAAMKEVASSLYPDLKEEFLVDHVEGTGLLVPDTMIPENESQETLPESSPSYLTSSGSLKETTEGNERSDWLTYLVDPRYSIQIPPDWALYGANTTSLDGVVVMFWNKQNPPSFISVLALDNPDKQALDEKEVIEIEETRILDSFSHWNVSIIREAGAFGTLGEASASYLLLAGGEDDRVISSYLLSDSSAVFWLSAIAENPESYQRNTEIFKDILVTFTPNTSDDAEQLWHM